MTWKRAFVVSLSLLALLIAGIAVWVIRTPEFRTAYHTIQMQRMRHATYANPEAAPNGLAYNRLGESHTSYLYHRDRLVELGVMFKRDYRWKHIWSSTDESRHIFKALFSSACPRHIDFVSPCPVESQPLELQVWCYPEDVVAWDKLVAERDVADYRERLMSDDPVR